MTRMTHSMFGMLEVKGAATEASASDREIPACAALRAYKQTNPHTNHWRDNKWKVFTCFVDSGVLNDRFYSDKLTQIQPVY